MLNSGSTISISPDLLKEIRRKFVYVEDCPIQGSRIFFENAGGALTLNSVVETSAKFAAIPDNQGRDNVISKFLMKTIAKSKEDTRVFFNSPTGNVFVGESGTELLFRIISVACLGSQTGGIVLGTTLEHPASRGASQRWSRITGKPHVLVPHNNETGTVTADDYRKLITDEVRVATIVHTSPVTGMGVDVKSIAAAIREKSPDAFIIVDGIQHASHGYIDVNAYGIDAYVISPYKVFSRHGYGVGWVSDRLAALPHEALVETNEKAWELGTRDTGAYATFSDVVSYFEWLGGHFTKSDDRREKIEMAGVAIKAQEKALTDAMLHGTGNLKGLSEMEKVKIIGGVDNPLREGLVSLAVDGVPSAEVVERLNEAGIRTHTRNNDLYSGNVLGPLEMDDCVRVSLCHYNSEQEVAGFLAEMAKIAE